MHQPSPDPHLVADLRRQLVCLSRLRRAPELAGLARVLLEEDAIERLIEPTDVTAQAVLYRLINDYAILRQSRPLAA